MKGFSPKWIKWVETFISGRSVAINVNDEIGHFFQTKKGLCQEDSLSPFFQIIVADMLTIFTNRAKEEGQLSGVMPHLVHGGLLVLQYTNNTIALMENDLEQA